jgi:undecaprenyl-diphosphatase
LLAEVRATFGAVSPSPTAGLRRALVAFGLAVLVLIPAGAFAAPLGAALQEADSELTPAKAVVLGLVEGVTEYLPVSSTGHLLVVQRLLDIGTTPETEDAADSYAIAIQAGAILAVLFLYFGRVRTMAEGVIGRNPDGRRILIALAVSFIPAAVIALAFEEPIKDNLLGPGPVIAAWIVGGLVILLVADRWSNHTGGTPIEQITLGQATIIGFVQVLAMWPGTSRSLVTILGALVVGLSLAAAVEYSFLLGLITLGAATGYETLQNGDLMIEAYGWVDPLIGLVVSFVAAALAVKWLVGYLQRHSLAIFGWYRLGVAAVAGVLLLTGVI